MRVPEVVPPAPALSLPRSQPIYPWACCLKTLLREPALGWWGLWRSGGGASILTKVLAPPRWAHKTGQGSPSLAEPGMREATPEIHCPAHSSTLAGASPWRQRESVLQKAGGWDDNLLLRPLLPGGRVRVPQEQSLEEGRSGPLLHLPSLGGDCVGHLTSFVFSTALCLREAWGPQDLAL